MQVLHRIQIWPCLRFNDDIFMLFIGCRCGICNLLECTRALGRAKLNVLFLTRPRMELAPFFQQCTENGAIRGRTKAEDLHLR